MKFIRTAARALIIHNRKLLTIKMRDKTGIFYILPGGGQQHGETLHVSLKRECREEIGAEVEVGDLLYVREYIGKNHEFRQAHHAFHQVENVFRCHLKSPDLLGTGSEHDKKQIGVEWIPLEHLSEYRILPEVIKSCFTSEGFEAPAHYLGDIN